MLVTCEIINVYWKYLFWKKCHYAFIYRKSTILRQGTQRPSPTVGEAGHEQFVLGAGRVEGQQVASATHARRHGLREGELLLAEPVAPEADPLPVAAALTCHISTSGNNMTIIFRVYCTHPIAIEEIMNDDWFLLIVCNIRLSFNSYSYNGVHTSSYLSRPAPRAATSKWVPRMCVILPMPLTLQLTLLCIIVIKKTL